MVNGARGMVNGARGMVNGARGMVNGAARARLSLRTSRPGDRGTHGSSGRVEESPDFTEQGDC